MNHELPPPLVDPNWETLTSMPKETPGKTLVFQRYQKHRNKLKCINEGTNLSSLFTLNKFQVPNSKMRFAAYLEMCLVNI